jgi:hypothetical protein
VGGKFTIIGLGPTATYSFTKAKITIIERGATFLGANYAILGVGAMARR